MTPLLYRAIAPLAAIEILERAAAPSTAARQPDASYRRMSSLSIRRAAPISSPSPTYFPSFHRPLLAAAVSENDDALRLIFAYFVYNTRAWR